jgi:hypothetical protein
MKRLLLLFGISFVALQMTAQIDMGIPSSTGKGGVSTAMMKNWEAIGINPSNLGWSNNYKFSMTLMNVGLTAQSSALDFATLKNAMLHPSDTFSLADKQKYSELFTNPDGFNMTANVNWIATSVYLPKLGGFGFSVRDRAFAHVGLNHNAADVLFNGKNAAMFQDSSTYQKYLSNVYDSCNISFMHFREANLVYGRRILSFGDNDADGNPAIQIYGGFGIKYIWGLANVNGRISNNQLIGQSAITNNYNINYGNIQNFTPKDAGNIFNSVGSGVGMDFGTSIILKNKFRFGASVTDIGNITWKNNVLVGSDALVTPVDSTNTGLHNWEVGSQAGFLFGNSGFMNYSPGSNYTSSLPTRLRLGYGMTIGKRIDVGADFVIPLNKELYNLSKPFVAVGGEFKVAEVLKFNIGVSGNSILGWNVPFGVTLGPLGPLEFGIATGDVLTFVDKSKNPNLSIAIAVLRINIDPKSGVGATVPPTPGI